MAPLISEKEAERALTKLKPLELIAIIIGVLVIAVAFSAIVVEPLLCGYLREVACT
jgi:hypothetical protein